MAQTSHMGGQLADGQRAESGRRQGPRGQLLWGLFGFLLGALFWHAIGFWDFLGGIVFKPAGDTVAIARPASPAAQAQLSTFADLEETARTSARNCTTLVRDAVSGRTSALPCIVILRNVPADLEAKAGERLLQTAARIDR